MKIDSRATEEVWGRNESGLSEALDAALSGNLFANVDDVQTIKAEGVVALHYARSYDLLEGHDEIWNRGLDVVRQQLTNQPEPLIALFSMKTGSLYPPPFATDARELIASEMTATALSLYQQGIMFRFRVVSLFKQASELLGPHGLQLLRPAPGGEFLIGDSPVVTSDATGRRHGISEGQPIGSASLVFMPLGPHLGVTLAPSNQDVEIDLDQVEHLNRWEVEAAHHDVLNSALAGLTASAGGPPSMCRTTLPCRPAGIIAGLGWSRHHLCANSSCLTAAGSAVATSSFLFVAVRTFRPSNVPPASGPTSPLSTTTLHLFPCHHQFKPGGKMSQEALNPEASLQYRAGPSANGSRAPTTFHALLMRFRVTLGSV